MAWCSVKAQGQLYFYLYLSGGNEENYKSSQLEACVFGRCLG